ncbi:MAG: anti-sigma factor antagonist [Oscillospiraceae bacterium]
MKIQPNYTENKLTLYFTGELDHHAAKTAMQEIETLIEELLPSACILDFGGLSFMDSSGLAVVLKAYKRMQELGRTAWVEHPPKQILRVLKAGGIGRIVEIRSEAEEEVR